MSLHAILEREEYSDKQVTGTFTLFNQDDEELFRACSLELPWRENKRRISCIPTGNFRAVFRRSQKYPISYHIKELDADQVNGRDWILIHQGNYYTDILGCILLGRKFADINGDGYKDVVVSKKTIQKLVDIAGNDGFTLEIKGAQPSYSEVVKINDEEPFDQGQVAVVIASAVNIRKTPNADAEKAGSALMYGTKIEILKSEGDWALIKMVNGEQAYVYNRWIRKLELVEGEG